MLPDKFVQEGEETNFLTYCSDGQPDWFGKLHTTTCPWLNATGPQDCWLTAEGWGGPVPTLTGKHLVELSGASSLGCCCCCCLPCEEGWDSSQGTPVVGKQVLGAEGRVLLNECLVHLLWWERMIIVERADPAGKIHNQSWALLVQINGNHHHFTFHTGAMQSFYCKAILSHQQTQDYHRPPRAIWSTVYSWVADYTDCILNSRMCTGSLCLWYSFHFSHSYLWLNSFEAKAMLHITHLNQPHLAFVSE